MRRKIKSTHSSPNDTVPRPQTCCWAHQDLELHTFMLRSCTSVVMHTSNVCDERNLLVHAPWGKKLQTRDLQHGPRASRETVFPWQDTGSLTLRRLRHQCSISNQPCNCNSHIIEEPIPLLGPCMCLCLFTPLSASQKYSASWTDQRRSSTLFLY